MRRFFCIFLAILALEFLSPQILPVVIYAQTDCTLYADDTGVDTNSGLSIDEPKTFRGGYNAMVPGDTLCLLDGTYYLNNPFYFNKSGTVNNWLKIRAYNPGGAIIRPNPDSNNFNQLFWIGWETAYVEFMGLTLEGDFKVNSAFLCQSENNINGPFSHHIRFIQNSISNTGSSGIATKRCDYIETIGNKIHRVGQPGMAGWSSGISYNSHAWSDNYPGIHSYIIGNIISGAYDSSSNHTDGNGIINDLAHNSNNSPPLLILNNLVYQNGGRCIHALKNKNNYVINNTCYSSSLDSEIAGTGSVGEFSIQQSSNNYFINNIAYAWTNGYSFQLTTGSTYPTDGEAYSNIVYNGLGTAGLPDAILNDPQKIVQTDPLFTNPLQLDLTADGQWENAVDPEIITNEFVPSPQSPAIDSGIDPTTVSGIPVEIKTDLAKYVYNDIENKPRPAGGTFDLGAYEVDTLSTPYFAPGDANRDNEVDGLDYLIWFRYYNTTTLNGSTDGDFDNNEIVDGLDYLIWLMNYSG